MRALIVAVALLVGACAARPSPFDLDKAVAEWTNVCTTVGPAGSPENNACVLQRYDTYKLLVAQQRAADQAAYAARLGAYGLVTRRY